MEGPALREETDSFRQARERREAEAATEWHAKAVRTARFRRRAGAGRRRPKGGRYMQYAVAQPADVERLRATERQCGDDGWMNRIRSAKNGRVKVADAVAPLLAQVEQGHGYVCSRYWRKFNKWGQPYGRAYADAAEGGVPVQRMPRELRAILLEGYCLDVDMKNAHIAITADILLQVDPLAREGKRYEQLLRLADPELREGMLTEIATAYRLDTVQDCDMRSAAKELMLRFLYVDDGPAVTATTITSWKSAVVKKYGADACAEFTAARVPGQVLDFAHQLHKARGVILGINGASLLWMVRIEIVLKPLSQLKGRG